MQLFETYMQLKYPLIPNIHVSIFEKMVSTHFYWKPVDDVCDYVLFFFGNPKKENFL
jgi:hypothetical protein